MNPTLAVDIEPLLNSIQDKIAAHRPQDYDIVVHRNDYRLDDGWVYVVVHPTQPDVRASDYTRILEQIEDEIEREQHIKVLLVPTLED